MKPATEPLDHILRESAPPWRRSMRLTECGLSADNHPTLSRVEMEARWKELGNQRASLFTCMTCAHTANRHPTWATDPAGAMARECEHYRYRDDGGEPIRSELRAIAALIEAHPDEFYDYLDGLAETSSLDERRRIRKARR